jgi:hypothetical protein
VAKSRHIPAFSRRDRGKPQTISVLAADVPAEIRIEHLPNKSLERYRYAIPLGGNFLPS